MRASSNPDTLLNSARSISVIGSSNPGVPLFQFDMTSPQTNKTPATVETIRMRRDRNAVSNPFALLLCGTFLSRDDLSSDRDLGVVSVSFAAKSLPGGVVSESENFAVGSATAASIAAKIVGSVVPLSCGSSHAKIENNTEAEHPSGLISNFDGDSDTVNSRETRMSFREIGRKSGKL